MGAEIGLGDLAIGDEFGASFGDSFGASNDLASMVNAALSGEVGVDDVLGDMADMGYDPDTMGEVAAEIGRRRARRVRRGRPSPNRGMSAARPASAPATRPGAAVLGGFGPLSAVHQYTPPQGVGGRVLPLDSGAVAAGANFTITISPQDTFRAERLIYAGAAATFTIFDFRIKNVPQFISAGNVPADLFAPNAVDQRLNFTPCPVGGQIQIGVNNFTGAAATFRGGLAGSAAVQI